MELAVSGTISVKKAQIGEGSTPEAALKGIRKVVADVVADLEGRGKPVPEPLATRNYSGKFVVLVPPDVQRRLSLEAAEAGVSLNRLASARLSQ